MLIAVAKTARWLSVGIIAALTLPAIAQADTTLLPADSISQIAGATFQNYQIGNVNQMLAEENTCWDDASREKGSNKQTIVAACASAAMSGAFIEATYARSQRRGSHPQYTGDAVRARILKKSGLSEAETQRILETTVEPNVPAILAGLKGAGMR